MNKTTRKQHIIRQLPLLVLIYCICQPLLDVATFWQERLEITNVFTVIIRMGLLCSSVILGFFLSDRKKYYGITALVLGGFLAFRTLTCIQAGYHQPMGDLSNMVRIYLLPLTTLCFCTFLRQNHKVIRWIQKGFFLNLLIIASVMVLSRITGTDPYTYPNKQLGIRGWFYFANSQSAILAMIVPVAIGWTVTHWKKSLWAAAGFTAISMGCLFFLGTRLAFASLIAGGFGMTVCLLLIDRRNVKKSMAIGTVTLIYALMLPLSPMVQNQKLVAGNFEIKQAAFDAAAEVPEGASEEIQQAALAEAYQLFVPGLMQRFGSERTLEMYHQTHDVHAVGNWRLMRLNFCRMLMEDSPQSARWFGISRSRMSENVIETDVLTGETKEQTTWYDPENDFHGIYYLCGGIGLALMLCFIGYFAIRALLTLVRDFKNRFTVDFAAISLSCCCAAAHCYFTASVLRFNSASVYFAIALAVLWYLSVPIFHGGKRK